MSISNRQKKENIFKIFSQNLEWVKEHPSIRFEPDFTNGYICPLCFDVFSAKDLDNSSGNPLTLEHVPPASLGGKSIILTCRKCNSRSGHELDAHLLKKLLELNAHYLLPNSETNATYILHDNKMNGVLKIDEKGTFKFDLQPKRSDPKQSEQFMKDLIPRRFINHSELNPDELSEDEYRTPTFSVKISEKSDEKRAEVALLRIAYLLAYSILGNSFLINGGLYKVREQILNPEKVILPGVFWIKYDFPKDSEGINIISLPKELQCFLVIFSLYTKSQPRRYAIVLPGPSDPGIKVYDFIKNNLCVGDGTNFIDITVEHLPQRKYLKNRNNTFAGTWLWQQYTKADYKPRMSPSNI